MVDITKCEECGKLIPATENGCAYCDSEVVSKETDFYLPLVIRMLLFLFACNLLASILFAGLSIKEMLAQDKLASVALAVAVFHISLCSFCAYSLLRKFTWSWKIPVALIVFELILSVLLITGNFEADLWVGGVLAPLRSVMFFFLFLRKDVQSIFEPTIMHKQELADLMTLVEGGRKK